MTAVVKRRNRRGRKKPAADIAKSIRQLPRKSLANPFPPLSPLDDEQIEHIHDSSMQLLEEQGIEVLGERALEVFRKAGAKVDSSGVVRMDRGLVMEAISKAPREFTVTPRNPKRSVHVGRNSINFGLVSGPPNVHDCLGGRRPGNIEDYRKVIKLAQFFNIIHFIGTQGVATTDLPPNTRHLDTTYINLTDTDKTSFTIGIGGGRIRDAAQMTAIALGISLEEMKTRPSLLTNINVNSPRKLDDSMAYAAMQMSMLGQPVIVTPFTLMGAMTPASMAGALVQQNAEALLGISLLQLTAPGSPVVYGAFTTNVDMRSGSPAFGTPENSLANMASGQLARRYQLPYRSSACNASNVNDCQATWETQMALWSSVMGHANIIFHSAGWLEGGLLTSFEKIVTDCEMLQHISRLFCTVTINDSEIGLEAMDEVGPGGHFFGSDHTLERYKDAFYEPYLSDWQNSENWQGAGSKDATMRATEIWQQILRECELPPTDPGIKEELEAFVLKRKEQLGRDEPTLEPMSL